MTRRIWKGSAVVSSPCFRFYQISGTGSNEPKDKQSSKSATGTEQQVDNPKSVEQSNDYTTSYKLYEVVKVVGEQKAYVDQETGFVFAVDEITNFLGTRGVLSRYTLPDRTRSIIGINRWLVGHRVDFQYQGRKFFMVIEEIDYNQKNATIRIKEIPNTGK